ncbi:LysM peptidoglycan-binding domain-containing protein [Actinopolymorpha singaporensis]
MSNSASVVYLEDFVSRRAGGAPGRGRRHLSPVAPPVRPGDVQAGDVRPFLRMRPWQVPEGATRTAVPGVTRADLREEAGGRLRPTPTPQPPAVRRRPPRPRGVRSCVLPAGGRGAGSSLRLTRRGRLVLTTMTALAALALAGVLGLLAQAVLDAAPAAGAAGPTATTTITVEPGETMWGIATQLTPNTDPRATIDEIARLNDLSRAGDLRVGQRLIVPVQAR